MKKRIYKTGELNGSSFVKLFLRSNVILKKINIAKYCFIWSILATLHPFDNDHPNGVSNYKQYFNELNVKSFDFTNGIRCSDVLIFEKLNDLSTNIFQLNFRQDKNK